ncbi:5'-3' exonuclease [Planococcus lenghuensis]|uniref:5'-3' exonuclease n=1 Tax=Planococcus lenghuensis TaxID=2213202 RepID=A0A1Q2KX27_9BACL|nr:5'-3' exonuclease [Planococcus lenghuensis]AQQ52676.1 flap endonuclease [Planococcus lenghuensis]
MNKPHILLVDGMAVLFRNYFATAAVNQFMRTPEGLATNGVQGFVRHVLTAKTLMKPTHMAVCWDMGAITFRNDLFDGYKANRPAPPEDMVHQFDLAKEISEQLGWQNYGKVGIEADDFIGSFTEQWKGDVKITIISGDKDLLQLLSPDVRVSFMKKGFHVYDHYTEARFREEYEIEPIQFADVKAFMGDASDGYPGVKGIGPKQALQFIKAYGSVEGVLEAIDDLKPGQRKKIEDQLDMLHLSKELAEIRRDIPLDVQLADLLMPTYSAELVSILEQRGLGLVARHIEKISGAPVEDPFA